MTHGSRHRSDNTHPHSHYGAATATSRPARARATTHTLTHTTLCPWRRDKPLARLRGQLTVAGASMIAAVANALAHRRQGFFVVPLATQPAAPPPLRPSVCASSHLKIFFDTERAERATRDTERAEDRGTFHINPQFTVNFLKIKTKNRHHHANRPINQRPSQTSVPREARSVPSVSQPNFPLVAAQPRCDIRG